MKDISKAEQISGWMSFSPNCVGLAEQAAMASQIVDALIRLGFRLASRRRPDDPVLVKIDHKK
jgi:hypothetical protein